MRSTYQALAASVAALVAVGVVTTADAQERVRWKMQSAFPGNMPHTGVAAKRLEAMVDRLSGGNFELKFFEYKEKWDLNHIPGPNFIFEGRPDLADHLQIFFSLYFAMTGLHALHMIIGIPILAIIAWMAQRGRFSPAYHSPVEMVGLYWHFVDIVWIFLFPLLYLIGRHVQ